MTYNLLLVAEMRIGTLEEALAKLDGFREAVQPAAEYGITFRLAAADMASVVSSTLVLRTDPDGTPFAVILNELAVTEQPDKEDPDP